MATIKTTPMIAAGAAPAVEVATVTEVITRLAAWLRALPPRPSQDHPQPESDTRSLPRYTTAAEPGTTVPDP